MSFDTANQDIVLRLPSVALAWIISYLIVRKQTFSISKTLSNYVAIKFGLPQGSILGPLLFINYINDLANVNRNLSFMFLLMIQTANIKETHVKI